MGSDERRVSVLSDGEFDERYLINYDNEAELIECCKLALEELADEPFLGRASNARVMGRAMQLLRDKYRVNAPRGWYPAMKRLRASSEKVIRSTVRGTDSGTSHTAAEIEEEVRHRKEFEEQFRILPNKIFTVSRSPFYTGHEWCEGLADLLRTRPDIEAFLINLAKTIGPPTYWKNMLSFINIALQQLSPQPGVLIKIRDRLVKLTTV